MTDDHHFLLELREPGPRWLGLPWAVLPTAPIRWTFLAVLALLLFLLLAAKAGAQEYRPLYNPPEHDRGSYTIRDESGEAVGHVRPHHGPPGTGYVVEDDRGEITHFLTPVVPGSDSLVVRDREFRPTGEVLRRR